ncbi:50S ribosomal protein L25 [Saliniradius amylolyticus]|uniref:Large ribosomal subunit protein bL25 n=1 Tax=Saliniradius amylolyticus TaxID=2183582 RepID=A0A2S2E1G7_9ALTE|nr:50S ribosomal protein L25/general stress protein Ctc [Saliniradius amylolyticus]AWL11495.1 50S ribosomal protein L25 [Saliniradius amylolyticus]
MSEAIFHLDAEVRTDMGKGASRRLRRADKLPAILYGAGKDPVALTLDHNKVNEAQDFEAFYSHVLTLNIGGDKVEALVKDMQRHPYKPKLVHVDFLRVDANQKVTTHVPIHFLNEDKAPAIKTNGGVPEHHINDIEVTCLPSSLPEYIEVDLMDLEIGETLHLTDVKLPKGVESVELAKGEDHDQAVVTIKTPKTAAAEEDEGASEAADSGDEEASTEE